MNTENNKSETNRLIAELGMVAKFVGYTPGIVFNSQDYPFNTDWNWLMEVVEKIESLKFEVFIETYEIRIELYENTIFRQHTKVSNQTKIQAVYNACVDFINWYNLNKE